MNGNVQTQERPETAQEVVLLPGKRQDETSERRSAHIFPTHLLSSDSAKLYRDEIARVDLLSTEEVVCLAQRIERGKAPPEHLKQPGHKQLIQPGESAKRKLMTANRRLVI